MRSNRIHSCIPVPLKRLCLLYSLGYQYINEIAYDLYRVNCSHSNTSCFCCRWRQISTPSWASSSLPNNCHSVSSDVCVKRWPTNLSSELLKKKRWSRKPIREAAAATMAHFHQRNEVIKQRQQAHHPCYHYSNLLGVGIVHTSVYLACNLIFSHISQF